MIKKKQIIISINVTTSLNKRLTSAARKKDITKSKLIRELIEKYL